jgi:RNA polymerase sigma factor (sigma-70 family)
MSGSGMSSGSPVSVEELLAQDEWVRRLARTLVAGRSGVDAADVAQETWRHALARPPKHGGHLRAWLAAIARNVVRRAGRDDATRARHEARAGARGDATSLAPAAAEVVERAQLQRRVADAVLALDEPYRSTILLRFFDELAPSAIALKTNVPVETVKTRLKRGLAQLRERLQGEFAGEERSLNAALLVLGGSTLVLSKAAKVGLAAAIVIALSATVPLLVSPGPRTPITTTVADPAAVRELDAESAIGGDVEHVDDAAPIVAEREELTLLRPDQFLVQVIDAATKAPVARARVTWADDKELQKLRERQGGAEPHDVTELLDRFGATGITDPRGRLVIARPLPFATFSAEHDGRWALRRSLWTKKESSVTLELSADDCVRVKVVDRGGRPVSDVAVAFGIEGANLGHQSRRAWTRALDGVALIRDLREYMRGFSGNDRPWCVMLLFPSFDAPTARVDPERLPKETVVLTLPECGSMTYSFVGRDGKPVDAPLDCRFIAFPRLELALDAPSVTRRSLSERTLFTSNGKLDHAYVGTGLDFIVTAKLDDVIVAQENFLNGPSRVGEHVDVTVHADVGPVRFRGQLVNDSGQVLYDTDFTLQLPHLVVDGETRTMQDPLRATGRTDRDGRFELLIDLLGTLGTDVRFDLVVSLDPDTTFVVPKSHHVVDRGAPIDLGPIKVPRR